MPQCFLAQLCQALPGPPRPSATFIHACVYVLWALPCMQDDMVANSASTFFKALLHALRGEVAANPAAAMPPGEPPSRPLRSAAATWHMCTCVQHP